MKKQLLLKIKILFISLFFLSLNSRADEINQLADQVHSLTLQLEERASLVKKVLPLIVPEKINSIHLYQKLIDLLYQINRYRITKKLGKISIPSLPNRIVEDTDLIHLLQHVVGELKLLQQHKEEPIKKELTYLKLAKTQEEIFIQLIEVQSIFEALIDDYGITPEHIYYEVQWLLNITNHILLTQHIPIISINDNTQEERPANHIINAGFRLLKLVQEIPLLSASQLTLMPLSPKPISNLALFNLLRLIQVEFKLLQIQIGIPKTISRIKASRITNIQHQHSVQILQEIIQRFPIEIHKVAKVRSFGNHDRDNTIVSKRILGKLQHYLNFIGHRIPAKSKMNFSQMTQKQASKILKQNINYVNTLRKQYAELEFYSPSLTFPYQHHQLFYVLTQLDGEINLFYQHHAPQIITQAREHFFVDEINTKEELFSSLYEINQSLSLLVQDESLKEDENNSTLLKFKK